MGRVTKLMLLPTAVRTGEWVKWSVDEANALHLLQFHFAPRLNCTECAFTFAIDEWR